MRKVVKKKVSAKKNIKPSKDELFGQTEKEYSFMLCDGRSISNLLELTDALETMDYGTFNYHVNESRNDFAQWIKDVMHKDDLADELALVRDKEQAQVVILKHLLKKLL